MKVSGFISSWRGLLLAISFMAVSAFQNVPIISYPRTDEVARSAKPKLFSTTKTIVDIDEDAVRDIQTMDQWATACGVQRVEGFQLTMNTDGTDCSVMTTQRLAANQPVVMVPAGMILTGGKARDEFGVAQAAEELLLYGSVDASEYLPQFYLFLKILREYELGDQSPWYPWLNSLPRFFSNGASLTRWCTDCLPGLAGWLTSRERIRFAKYFRALDCVDFLNDRTKKHKDLAQWAFAVVSTRSFPTGNGDMQIIPMADMFNHGIETEIQLSSDDEGNCYAYTTVDVQAGSPLRMSYGDPTNPSRLLARYGFVDESSPATFCKIMIFKPTQELLDLGYDHSRMVFYKDTGDVSQEVWDVLLYQLLGESNVSDQQTFYLAHMKGDHETKQKMHSHYFPQTCALLQVHVETFLGELDRLTRRAQGGNIDFHPRLPLLLKHNTFVKQTFLKVKARLSEYV